ncbi:O-antigen ligase family protein [Geomonas sp. RF6]|uniref:O-antigen ligase family protein n=1 Tax=Geomonas sp. RF6 TaxID=2897342 RepID=UPI001E32DFC2|nr:O-antigen ligase family protein [Geomonas sp. RF6]UFS69933.1 O-antigen ligase family protein [Geomonas sp. RF6]
MNPDIIKACAPPFFFIIWFIFAQRAASRRVAGAALFFTSAVACSQNFSLCYRQVHQLIQVFLIAGAVFSTIFSWRVLRCNSIFAVLAIFIGISLAFAPLDADARVQLVNIISVVGVLNYLYLSCQEKGELQELMRFIAFLAVALALAGIAQSLLAPGTRAEGTMNNPNYYGYVLGLGCCLVAVECRGMRRILALLILMLGILVSGSRSALFFPLLQVAWSAYRTGNVRRTLGYLCACALVVGILLSLNLTRFSDTEASQGSDAERIIFAMIALRMANDHPFTGVGWGRFVSEFGAYSTGAEKMLTDSGSIDVSDQERRVTHNDLVRILAELGWVACLATVALSLWALVKIFRRKGFGAEYLFSVWLGTVTFSLTHNNLNGALFWFFFLLPFFLDGQARQEAAVPASFQRVPPLVEAR